MALQTTGAISIDDIATEFGGTTPHSLSEYYGVDTGVPTSGSIDISDFYGTSAAASSVSVTHTIFDDASSKATSGYYECRRVGYGLSGANDFFYPEYVSNYSAGFGSCTNSTNVFSGATVSQITVEEYPGTTQYLEWFQFCVKDGPNSKSAFNNIVVSYQDGAGYAQTATFYSSNSSFFTKSSSRLSTTVRTWAWTSTNTTGYDSEVATLSDNMQNAEYIGSVTGTPISNTVTINF